MDREEQKQGLESPLIPNYAIESRKGLNRDEIFREVKKQLSLAGPIVSVNVLVYCLQVISVMFVGHLGELALSGASMATSFAAVTGFSLMTGMASALDTFCGQSYGAKQYHMLGILKQRAMFVLLLASIPLACIWANTRQILVFLGQDPEISAEAGSYARFMIPSIFAFALLQCHVRFLQAQNNVVPMMLSAGFTTLLHILICWILVFKSGLGNKGAALANAISYWINVALLAIYVRVSPSCKKTWTGFSKEALQDVPKFLRLAIPSALMICLEIWSFEMMVLLSGLLPNPKLETSVLSISLNTCALFYMIPLGLSGATSIRVSNELGAGRPQAARLAVCIAVCLVATEGIFVASVMILGRNVWGYCYSKEEKVVRYVGEMLILIAGSHCLDGIQSVLSGTARGCGWQKIGAFFSLYRILGPPALYLPRDSKMLSLAFQPSASGSFKPSAFTYPTQKLIAKIPFKNSIFARPKASSFQSPTVSVLQINRGERKFKLSASSAPAVDAVALETPAEDSSSSTQLEREKLGVVVKSMQKPRLVLKFIWMEKNVGLALDHVIPGHGTIPLSPCYFWPRKDAWEELKVLLESKPWVSQKQMIILLNQATDIINLWQQSGGDLA